jgi:magnesium transporter
MEEGDKLWLLGMFMNISGSIMVNFGTNLMKSAHNIALEDSKDDTDESEGETKLFSSANLWKIGMSIFVIGSLVNFASFAFAAQSLLAALGTVQFISNVFFAKFILKEELTPRIMIATAIIIFGLTLAIIFSNHSTQLYTTQDLLDMYTPDYILFMTFVVVFMLFLHAVYMVYTVNEEVGTPLPGNHLIRPVTYAMVSATVGTQSVLQSKCLAELIKATFEGVNQFDKPFVYIIIAIFAFGLSFWLYRMNAALKKFDGLLIIPLLQVFWTTSAIVQGGVYFQEFIKFTPTQTVGFLMGVGIVFVGVYLLTPQPRDPADELLPSESSHSIVDASSSTVPSTGFYQQRHGLGLGGSHLHLDGQSEGIDHTTRSMVGLTCLPVVIETLPARHSHRLRGQSHHGMDNSSSSISAPRPRDLELQSITNQLHTQSAPPPSSQLRLGHKTSSPPSE